MGMLERIDSWWLYFVACFPSDYSSVDCRAYWNWVADGAFTLAGLIIVLVSWSLYRQYSAFWRGRLHMKGAPATWNTTELESAQMEAKFRAALEKRKSELRNSESPP